MADNLDVNKLLADLADTDLGKQLLGVFGSNPLPKITTNQLLGEDTAGEYNLDNKSIRLSWQLNPGMSKADKAGTSLAHELTHAADHVMAHDVIADPEFPSDYGDQIKKFWSSDETKRISKILPIADTGPYRNRLDESGAFGVGNTVGSQAKSVSVWPVAHADASRAQDFAVQADLFKRGKEAQKAKAAEPDILDKILSLIK